MELVIAPAPEISMPEPGTRLTLEAKAGHTTARRSIPLIFGTFFLSGHEFAIELAELQELGPLPAKLQNMPLAPEFVKGLFNLRGRILPVVDLRELLRLQPIPASESDIPCMVILSRGPACIGVLFDAMGEILRVHRDEIVPVHHRNPSSERKPSPVQSILTRDGGERIIQILDLASLLTIQNLPALERRSPQRLAEKNFVTQRMKDLRREKLIGFTIAQYNLAIEMNSILAIVENDDIKPSPCKSALCSSVVMFRKHMVPIVSLAQLLRIETTEPPERILICNVDEHRVGLAIDDIVTIMAFSQEKILPIPILAEYRSTCVRGCFTDTDGSEFFVLNRDGVLASSEVLDIAMGHTQMDTERQEQNEQAIGPRVSILTFRMGKLYGIKLLDVVEVLEAPKQLVRTPGVPPAVLGVLTLRGTPISVLDPRQLLQLDPAPPDAPASILVFAHEGKKIAIRVDSIESILTVPAGPELELPEIFFREERPKLSNSFERGLHVETNGVKTVVLILSTAQIVKLLFAALESNEPKQSKEAA
jgi:purine-binding chemotaxis protein CheW